MMIIDNNLKPTTLLQGEFNINVEISHQDCNYSSSLHFSSMTVESLNKMQATEGVHPKQVKAVTDPLPKSDNACHLC